MKTITLTDGELEMLIDAVTLQRSETEDFYTTQHDYTVACNRKGYVDLAKPSAVLECKLKDELKNYDYLLTLLLGTKNYYGDAGFTPFLPDGEE